MNLNVSKDSETVIKYLQENYEENVNVQRGVKILAQSLCQRVDNPRKNLEICVMRKEGLKYLTKENMEDLITLIEKEDEDNKMDEEKK